MNSAISFDPANLDDRYDLLSLYSNEQVQCDTPDSPFINSNIVCDYHDVSTLAGPTGQKNCLSYFHINCRGLSKNWESFKEMLCSLHSDFFAFDFIGVSEIFRCEHDQRLSLPGYHDLLTRCRSDSSRGGVGLYIRDNIQFKVREDLSIFIPHVFESIFVEYTSDKPTIVGVIYRPNSPPKANIKLFSETIYSLMDSINSEKKAGIFMGDMNIDLLKFQSHKITNDYLDNLFLHGFLPVISKPTRISTTCATLIDHIYTNRVLDSAVNPGIIITDIADHFGVYLMTNRPNQKRSSSCEIKTRVMNQRNISTF